MGKNKKRELKNYTHDQAQTFAYNIVIRKVTRFKGKKNQFWFNRASNA
jgi:hypothetical protein